MIRSYAARLFGIVCGALPLVVRGQHLPPAASPQPRWAVRWAPVSLTDPFRPTLQLGAEYFLLSSLSVGVDVGTRTVLFKNYRRPGQQVRHQTVRAEVRYYLPQETTAQQFVAVEGFYVPYRYTDQRGLLRRHGQYYTYDEARIRHRTWGTAIKYGWRHAFGVHDEFWWETALGLGLRRKPARYSRLVNEQLADSATVKQRQEGRWGLSDEPDAGSFVDRVHLVVSFRLGYMFYQRPRP